MSEALERATLLASVPARSPAQRVMLRAMVQYANNGLLGLRWASLDPEERELALLQLGRLVAVLHGPELRKGAS